MSWRIVACTALNRYLASTASRSGDDGQNDKMPGMNWIGVRRKVHSRGKIDVRK